MMSDHLHRLHTSNEILQIQLLDKGTLRAFTWKKQESHKKPQSEQLAHRKFNPATVYTQQLGSDVQKHYAQCT